MVCETTALLSLYGFSRYGFTKEVLGKYRVGVYLAQYYNTISASAKPHLSD